VQKVFAHKLRGYNRTDKTMATQIKIVRSLFGSWEELMQNVFGVISSGGKMGVITII